MYGDNNKVVAWAGVTFASVEKAQRAAHAFTAAAATAEFDVYDVANGKWSWSAWRTCDEDNEEARVATSPNHFTTKQNARRAAENVRMNAPHADWTNPNPASN